MEYFIILLLLTLATFAIEKIYHVHLYKSRKERFVIVSILFTLGTLWDSFAIIRGHWTYPLGKTLGITIGVMPIEDYLFMLVVPYLCITTYKVVDSKYFRVIRKRRKS